MTNYIEFKELELDLVDIVDIIDCVLGFEMFRRVNPGCTKDNLSSSHLMTNTIYHQSVTLVQCPRTSMLDHK